MLYPLSYGGSGALVAARAYNTGALLIRAATVAA